MAKDNLFLGFGRGKVGDVVFYRSNGTQITRARNRNPRNPNSVPQRVVRAVNASVSRLYSIGQEIFNHAFEGAATPADNQRRFNSLNINLLRGLIADDLNSGRVDGDCLARVGARGLSAAVPFNGMQLSSGKLPNNAFEMKSDGRFGMPEPLHSSPNVYTETVAQYATRIGLVEGDIYTFVMIGTPGTTDSQLAYYGAEGEAFNPCAAIFPFFFNYAQLIVKAEAFTNTDLISTSTKLSAIFAASDRGINLTNQPILVLFTPADIDSRMVNGVAGCIHSRESTGLRSTTFAVAFQSLPGENGDWGLTTNYLAQAWQTGDSNLRGDELVLDGKYFEQSASESPRILSVMPELPVTTAAQTSETFYVFGSGFSWDTFDHLAIVINNTTIHLEVDKSEPQSEDWFAYYNSGGIMITGGVVSGNLIRFSINGQTTVQTTVSSITLD
jgi:hypothetical protein